MRNGRELYRIRTENLDWNNRIIFVPDSKIVNGRRMIPMGDRAYEVLRARAAGKAELLFSFRSFAVWSFDGHGKAIPNLMGMGKQFRIARRKAQLPRGSCLVLRTTRLWDEGPQQHRQSGGGDEENGAQGCQSCHAVSASRP